MWKIAFEGGGPPLRLGTFDLELEKGRHSGVGRDSRICKICFTKNIENEDHFVFTCPPLSITRKPYVDEISKINENFSQLSPNNKLRFLCFNDELDDETERIAAESLLALERHREFLIKL